MAETLSPVQSAALFDILTHYDTYSEIREFRHPGSLAHYGPPFTAEPKKPSTSPALQILVSKFLLTLPGLKNLPDNFWKVQCQDIIDHLEQANLSESYDKGVIGSRKTLATAISALIEYPVRGTYGGFPEIKNHDSQYDVTKAEDLSRSFREFMNDSIYGTALEDLVAKTAETDNLDDHTPLTKAVHEYVLVNLASFMHYTLILSPKGQYLLKLVDNANKLVPYMVLKQTLRIGNVASMIQALVKVGLAKMSMASVTNWMGLTQHQDEGMNLMQTIISTVLHWDIKDLETRATKIERERAKNGKDQIHLLKEYTKKPLLEQEKIRKESQHKSISIVAAILKHGNLSADVTDAQHTQLLEYLSVQLSIRDRRQLIKVLCRSTPDHLTQSVRELVDAYEPVIRRAHKAIDLSSTLGDFEYFLKDLIKLARIQTDKATGKSIVPTVGDFVQLLRKHQKSCHIFIHQCCKNDKELTGWYLDWAKHAAQQFKRDPENKNITTQSNDPNMQEKGAGSLTPALHKIFHSLPEETQRKIPPILDSHSKFLETMHAQSSARLANVLKSPPSKNPAIAKIFSSTYHGGGSSSTNSSRPSSRAPSPAPPASLDRNSHHHHHHHDHHQQHHQHSHTAPATTFTPTPSNTAPPAKDATSSTTPEVTSSPGPGAFLARWQALLDATPITPITASGTLNTASSPAIVRSSATDVDGSKLVHFGSKEARGDKIRVETGGLDDGDKKASNGGVGGTEEVSSGDKDTSAKATATATATTPDGIAQNARERQKALRVIVEAMGVEFRKLLAETACDW